MRRLLKMPRIDSETAARFIFRCKKYSEVVELRESKWQVLAKSFENDCGSNIAHVLTNLIGYASFDHLPAFCVVIRRVELTGVVEKLWEIVWFTRHLS